MTSSSRYGAKSAFSASPSADSRSRGRAVVVGEVEVGDAEVEGAAQDAAGSRRDGPDRSCATDRATARGASGRCVRCAVGHVRVAVGVCGVQRDSRGVGARVRRVRNRSHSGVTCGQWSNRRIRWDCADTLLSHGTASSPALRGGRRGPALHTGRPNGCWCPSPGSRRPSGAGAGAAGAAVRAHDRRVTLTEAGRALLEEARRILAQVRSAHEAVAAVQGVLRGTLSLGTEQCIAGVPVAGLLAAFRREHPDVEIRLRQAGSGELAEEVAAGGSTWPSPTDAGGHGPAAVRVAGRRADDGAVPPDHRLAAYGAPLTRGTSPTRCSSTSTRLGAATRHRHRLRRGGRTADRRAGGERRARPARPARREPRHRGRAAPLPGQAGLPDLAAPEGRRRDRVRDHRPPAARPGHQPAARALMGLLGTASAEGRLRHGGGMHAKDILIEGYGRIREEVHATVGGLPPDGLNARPATTRTPSPGWCGTSPGPGRHVADAFGLDQVWLTGAWDKRFGLGCPASTPGTATARRRSRRCASTPPTC